MVAVLKIDVPKYMIEWDKKNLKSVMRAAGQEIASAARSDIRSATGGGKIYHGKAASAPGGTPVNRSGELAGSISITQIGKGTGVKVTDKSGYALALEAGSKGGGGNTTKGNLRAAGTPAKGRYGKVLNRARQIVKSLTRVLAPRPFLSKALEDKRASIEPKIEKAIMEGLDFKKL